VVVPGHSFSRHGALLNMAASAVTQAAAGYLVEELEAVLKVRGIPT